MVGVYPNFFPKKTLYTHLVDIAASRGDQIALHFEGEQLSYNDLIVYSNKLAGFLVENNVSSSDNIAVLMWNEPWLLIAALAASQINARVVLINPRLSEREILFQLRDSEAKAIITTNEFCQKVSHVLKFYSLQLKVLFCPKHVNQDNPCNSKDCDVCQSQDFILLHDIFKTSQPYVNNRSSWNNAAIMLYTGGTTGLPKAVLLSHYNIISNSIQFNLRVSEHIGENGRCLAALPISHSFGLLCTIFAPLYRGEEIVLIKKFQPKLVLEAIENMKITDFYGVPTMYVALLKENIEQYDLSSLVLCISGGAKLNEKIFQEFKEKTGIKIVEGYGLTECSPVTHLNSTNDPVIGSIGTPLPFTEAKIIDPQTEEELKVEETGELVIKGPQVMLGYFKKSIETTKVFTRDGWLKTGDLCKRDKNGYYFIVDRVKDLINSGGYKIYPSEVEEILVKHPSIEQAVVAAIPDDYYGEVVSAFIVLKEGKTLTKEELKEFCSKYIASYKIPKIIEFVEELPISAAGKVLRRKLVEYYQCKTSVKQ